jgi:hypothetical protein
VVPGEDSQALADRLDTWLGDLAPANDVERFFAKRAVLESWKLDRAERSQTARLTSNIDNAADDRADREQTDVAALGERLFADRRGPLPLYPHCDIEHTVDPDRTSRVSWSEVPDDADHPAQIVLLLQKTAAGCEWMLNEWTALRRILEQGLSWQSPDKLKAIRLLGKEPIDAVDDPEVLMIFLATRPGETKLVPIFQEIINELRRNERGLYLDRLQGRRLERFVPKDAAAARQALLDIITRATERLTKTLDARRRRAEQEAELDVDRLAVDDSPEAERLLRFEMARGRALARSLDMLLKLRRERCQAASTASSAARTSNAGPETRTNAASAAAEPTNHVAVTNPIETACETGATSTVDPVEADEERNTTTEPDSDTQNTTNEANFVRDQRSAVRLQPSGVSGPSQGSPTDSENTTTEPNSDTQNTTTEPNFAEYRPQKAGEIGKAIKLGAGEIAKAADALPNVQAAPKPDAEVRTQQEAPVAMADRPGVRAIFQREAGEPRRDHAIGSTGRHRADRGHRRERRRHRAELENAIAKNFRFRFSSSAAAAPTAARTDGGVSTSGEKRSGVKGDPATR